MKKLNLAIIGQGRSGKNIHGRYYVSERNSFFNVKYVVDADEFRRKVAEGMYPGCKTFADYKALFDVDDIDLVVNSTYSEMHYPITKDLLTHGKNVLVEKPFSRTRYECEDLIKTAKEHGVVLAVFQQTFFAPFYGFAYEIMHSGKIGDVKKVLAAQNILKVGAASGDDVRGLQKIEGFTARGFVDLQKMVWEYGIKDKSVKKMSAIILGVRISKTQQLSNWEAETLSEAQCKYAATDAWICREMYLKLAKSERNPLTEEQMSTPEHLAKMEKKAEKARLEEEQRAAREAAGGRKRRRRHRHRRRKKAIANDSENIS